MIEWHYLAAALASAATITVALRAAPFALKSAIKASPLLADVNAWMPLGVTAILTVYCLSSVDLHNPTQSISTIVGVIVTVVMHNWRHNIFLSVVCATAACVVMANWVVPALMG